MFDIEQYVQEIEEEKRTLKNTELLLPEYMLQTIKNYEHSLFLVKSGKPDYKLDCYYDELNSDINVMENDGVISSEQAWYLRSKYLGRTLEEH